MYKIELDIKVAENFRNIINEYINFSIEHEYDRTNSRTRKKERTTSWVSVTAIMDRIEDLVIYLNEKKLNNGRWKRSAFDFYEFIEQAGVLIECIDLLFTIYDVEIYRTTHIFKHKKNGENQENSKEFDLNYFEYIRSLSAVHPGDTDRHKNFQSANFETSPYVVWNDGIYALDKRCRGDINLITYNNETEDFFVIKSIYINEIFNFIKHKYYSLNYLSKEVKKYYENMIQSLREKRIKKKLSFKNYNNYLLYLEKEAKSRDKYIYSDISDVIFIFNCKITNPKNSIKFEKYKNALKFAVKYKHRQLQNMYFDNKHFHDDLLTELFSGRIYVKESEYNNILEKMFYLKDDLTDYGFVLERYEKIIDFFQKYIFITKEDVYNLDANELYVLSRIALYFHSLEYENCINSIIPHTDEYR